MATVDKSAADRIIKNNGFWFGENDPAPLDDYPHLPDPRVVKVVEYENAWGGTSYGIVFETEADQFRYQRTSEFVKKPRVIWEYKSS